MSVAAMDQILLEFQTYLSEEKMRSPATIKRYLADIKAFCAFLRLTDPSILPGIQEESVLKFLKYRPHSNKSPSRFNWNLKLAALHTFFTFSLKRHLVQHNPTVYIDRMRVHPREPIPLNFSEIARIIRHISQHTPERYRARNSAIVQILFHTMLRVAELVSLDSNQVDLENFRLCNVRLKGGKWQTSVFTSTVSDALRAYFQSSLRKEITHPALFVSERGKRLSIRMVGEMVQQAARGAGITRPVGPHLLRHSGATALAELGVPLTTIQEICGHASLRTTERYLHLASGSRREALAQLEQGVARASPKHQNFE